MRALEAGKAAPVPIGCSRDARGRETIIAVGKRFGEDRRAEP